VGCINLSAIFSPSGCQGLYQELWLALKDYHLATRRDKKNDTTSIPQSGRPFGGAARIVRSRKEDPLAEECCAYRLEQQMRVIPKHKYGLKLRKFAQLPFSPFSEPRLPRGWMQIVRSVRRPRKFETTNMWPENLQNFWPWSLRVANRRARGHEHRSTGKFAACSKPANLPVFALQPPLAKVTSPQ
jgi:hypothetical protein